MRFSFGQAVTSEVCMSAGGLVGECRAVHVDRALQLEQGAGLVDPAVQRRCPASPERPAAWPATGSGRIEVQRIIAFATLDVRRLHAEARLALEAVLGDLGVGERVAGARRPDEVVGLRRRADPPQQQLRHARGKRHGDDRRGQAGRGTTSASVRARSKPALPFGVALALRVQDEVAGFARAAFAAAQAGLPVRAVRRPTDGRWPRRRPARQSASARRSGRSSPTKAACSGCRCKASSSSSRQARLSPWPW